MILARIGREYVAQIVAFIAAVADRLFTVGILIRLWGADGFAAWTVALSAAGMLALCDFGLTAYFSNRLFFAVEQGNVQRARHVFAAGNGALFAASSLGAVSICTMFYFYGRPVAGMAVSSTLFWTVALLSLATALRQAMAVVIASYRAHQDFFRQTLVTTFGDGTRIVATIVAALAGGGLLDVSFVYLCATVVAIVIFPLVDTATRYPGFTYRLTFPDSEERFAALRTSTLYWAQSGVNTVITFAPVFFLAGAGANSFGLAQFALMRTLANLVRAVLQLFANVFGLEAARRIAIGDSPGFAQVYRESAILLAVQTAAAAGVLAGLARDLFTLWTGEAQLFDPLIFALAVGPPILLPSLAMAVQLATCANMPAPLVRGRILQLAITVVLFFALPIGPAGLRMMAALALGELIGLGWPMTRAVQRIEPETGVPLHMTLALRGMTAGLIGFAGTIAGKMLFEAGSLAGLIVSLMTGAAAVAFAMLYLGLSAPRRHLLFRQASARLFSR